MDLKSMLNKDSESGPPHHHPHPPPPPPPPFSPSAQSSPQSFHHPPPPASFSSPTALHHSQTQQPPPRDYFHGVTPNSRASAPQLSSYPRPAQSPYNHPPTLQHSQSQPSISPPAASTPIQPPQSVRESPLSTSYLHTSPYTFGGPPSHPATPLGPPLTYNRGSIPNSREPTSPFTHQRKLSGTSYGAPAMTPIKAPQAGSPGSYMSHSPQLERKETDYAYQRERERTESVSPKTVYPSRQQSLESRHYSHEFEATRATPSRTTSLQSILQPTTPQQGSVPAATPSTVALPSPELLSKPLPARTLPRSESKSDRLPMHAPPEPAVSHPEAAGNSKSHEPAPSERKAPPSNLLGKRKRNDPKPVWAMKEREAPPELRQIRKAQRVISESKQVNGNHAQGPHHTPPQSALQIPPSVPPPNGGWQPSVSAIAPYDEVTRRLADFLWINVVENQTLAAGPAGSIPSSQGQLEVEAKLGVFIDRQTLHRLELPVASETVLHSGSLPLMFESNMNEAQHKALNQYLNKATTDSLRRPDRINYKHKREIDSFYILDPQHFHYLPPAAIRLVDPSRKSRIRITRDAQTNEVLAKIVKQRIANFDIYSPDTPFDYRITVSLEAPYDGPIDDLVDLKEGNKRVGRKKDRMCYRHQAYQIDLTQVTPIDGDPAAKTHELEIEVDTDELKREGAKARMNQPNGFEDQLVQGLLNNVRVLARAGKVPIHG